MDCSARRNHLPVATVDWVCHRLDWAFRRPGSAYRPLVAVAFRRLDWAFRRLAAVARHHRTWWEWFYSRLQTRHKPQ